jgi:histidine triad (HIT) family protein
MTNYEGNDIYCDLIIPARIDVKIIKETNNVLAFYHTKPHWPTHIVVVPKKHIDSLVTLDMDSPISKELLSVVQEMAAMVTKDLASCRVLTNLGDYQDSKHLHIHVSSGAPLHKA